MTAIDYILIAIAYLVGSISTAIIVCKMMGLPDPRTLGSKNPGATNVLRIGGKRAAAFTLSGDLLKGLLPVLVAQVVGLAALPLVLVGFAAFSGHLYPVFFAFRGGKGVATAFGVILGLSWSVAVGVLATWLIMAWLFRISSLSALTAALLAPFYCWLLAPVPEYMAMIAAISVILIWRHRSNIRKLLAGEER